MIASIVRVPWHTAHGGYDRLLDYLREVRHITPPRHPSARWAFTAAHHVLGPHPLPAAVLPPHITSPPTARLLPSKA
ncbi:hypothetical protein ACWF95_40895 [Streptomyces vinaceus]